MARKRAESPLRRRREEEKKKKNRKKKGYPEVLRGFHQANGEIQQSRDKGFIFCLPNHLDFEYRKK
jgi:hypothetical protein